MKWVTDSSSRFAWRPHYDQEELDRECEGLVTAFLLAKNGACRFPVPTNDLAVLVEQATSDLDLYADLSGLGEDVEGITDCFHNSRPAVRISRELSLSEAEQQRLRTTLAHEYGHVKFHAFLWEYNRIELPEAKFGQSSTSRKKLRLRQKYASFRNLPELGKGGPAGGKAVPFFACLPEDIFAAPESDWMEWQAGYISGAILMPLSAVQELAKQIFLRTENRVWAPDGSSAASDLIARSAETFDVPPTAARSRLLKLGLIQEV